MDEDKLVEELYYLGEQLADAVLSKDWDAALKIVKKTENLIKKLQAKETE